MNTRVVNLPDHETAARTALSPQAWAYFSGGAADEITLRQNGTSASRTDTGFVPLLHVHAQRQLGERTRLQLDGDGLTSSRGRAFDLSLRYVHDFQGGLSGFAGVRLLDGGANITGERGLGRDGQRVRHTTNRPRGDSATDADSGEFRHCVSL